MAAKDPETRAHRTWLGMLQPVGLVVSPPALVKGQALVPRNAVELQKRFVSALGPETEPELKSRRGREQAPPAQLRDFARFVAVFFDWEDEDLVGGDALPKSLEVSLPEYQQVLAPTWAVPNPDYQERAGGEAKDGPRPWLMLIVEVPGETGFDDAGPRDARGWRASPQIRLERLLRDTKVEIGLLVSGEALRLVYAPAGESSGHLSFPIAAMAEVGGRPILAAFHMLLCAERLFTLPRGRRLPALLVESRKYQNEVSTKLSEQVLRALGELLRGFVAANDVVKGELLDDAAREDPQHVYGGLITTMMRLVFLLYAEERELMPQDPVYAQHYGVSGLFETLRADAGLYPDTMDQRYGAWARLLSLFRLVFDGGAHGSMALPARHGQLFNPEEYAFLEGRAYRVALGMGERIEPPRVSDGVVFRVLEDLLLLDGERLSYRSLDVEQIGSVYEAIMGFEVERAFGVSIGVRPQHVVVNLDELLEAKAGARAKLLDKEAGCKLAKGGAKLLKEAGTIEELVAALGRRISPQTPTPLAPGSLYLQPTEERRRSGSHYTPRSLTEPIVRTTLRPVLEDLGERPTAAQILDLKVCDPAMGSGAFLVEACRQLADEVVEAWAAHEETPMDVPADESVELHARRLVAQRCLYGVDKNPFAVNLAKLSLWLVTLARDHAFTFIDHALKCGDSLVGLTRRQIEAFHWKDPDGEEERLPLFAWMEEQVGKARSARGGIFALGDEQEAEKRLYWREAEDALAEARLIGDLVISAFFAEEKDQAREKRRLEVWEKVRAWQRTGKGGEELWGAVEEMRSGAQGVTPFHWEAEFPEVFEKDADRGFSAIFGNPPYLGGTRISSSYTKRYLVYITATFSGAGDRADLVAYFVRKMFRLVRLRGTIGIVATNTISQGDTRRSGLRVILSGGGHIYDANRRYRWPGQASVIATTVHIVRCPNPPHLCTLNGRPAERITAYLFPYGTSEDPCALQECVTIGATKGVDPYGEGFLFEDGNPKASPLAEMSRLLEEEPENSEVIWPFLGGKQLNTHPAQKCRRYIINFGDLDEVDARRWARVFSIVETRVKPERLTKSKAVASYPWWRHWRTRKSLYQALKGIERCLVVARVSSTSAFVFVGPRQTLNEKIVVFPLDGYSWFTLLQSHVHEIWASFFGATLKDDRQYSITDCFHTFPLFPRDADKSRVEKIGDAYHSVRAEMMLKNNEGLTKTYNRFHDPTETSEDILKLRDLHDQMDRAVLDAYGWTDIKPTCEFLLDYEDEDDTTSKRKKPWRYRWPDEVQEEVLARLLDLNQKRAEEERLAGLTTDKKKPKKKKPAKTKRPRKKKMSSKQKPLFGDGDNS